MTTRNMMVTIITVMVTSIGLVLDVITISNSIAIVIDIVVTNNVHVDDDRVSSNSGFLVCLRMV